MSKPFEITRLINEDEQSISSGNQPPPSQHEHLLGEIESSEANLAGILRPLYDSNEETSFMSSLDTRIRMHEKTIEGMCNKHYRGFIDAVDELRHVKSDAVKMKTKIQEANEVIKDTGGKLLETGKELKMVHAMQLNVYSTMDVLTRCIPALEMFCQLEGEMEKRQYYEALKTLELLEHTLLPQISGYSFTKCMENRIPQTRKAIEDLSRNEMTDFLTTVRESADKVGECAMHQAQKFGGLKLAKEIEERLYPEVETGPDQCPQDLVDFSPVYRSLHIFSVLERREVFEEYYRNARLEQLRIVVIEADFKTTDSQIQTSRVLRKFKSYLYQIVGFFVVEDTILHTTQSLITRETLDTWWTMVVTRMLALLRTVSYQGDVYKLVKIKQLIVWFCHTIQGYGCQVDKLYELLLDQMTVYSEKFTGTLADNFMSVFKHDNYTPMVVETDDQYQGVLDVFPYRDFDLEKAPFPKRFPFSSFVPQIYTLLKNFVNSMIDYGHDLNISQTELDERVRKDLNLLLSNTLAHTMSTLICSSQLQIQELVQLWVNLHHLKEAAPHLEKYISKKMKTDGESVKVVSLYGISAFADAKRDTEDAVCDRFRQKITVITESAQYNWVAKSPSTSPSQYVEEIIQFLMSNFLVLEVHQLSSEFVERLTYQILKHIAADMREILVNPSVPVVSVPALQSFNVDVARFEDYACEHMKATRRDVSLSIFSTLRQILDMFLKEEWGDFIQEFQGKNQKYPQVHPQDVYQLLRKMREHEASKKGGVLHRQGQKKDKERIKFLDLYLKSLQTLLDKSSIEHIPNTQ